MDKKNREILRQIAEAEQDLHTRSRLEVAQAISRARQILQQLQSKEITAFPLDAFPSDIRQVITEFNKLFKFPVDYYGLGVLMATSTVIGNKFIAQYFPGWEAPALLYGVIIANSGVGKSKILKHCLAPIQKIHEAYKGAYNKEVEEWEIQCARIDRRKGNSYPKEPEQRRILTNNATTESLYNILKNNPQGILLKRDELKGFIRSMNQYRKGGDGEFWLEVFDNDIALVDRVGKVYDIKRVFINIFGCMQPNITKVLTEDGGKENGFLARFLFAFPENLEKPLPRRPDDLPDTRFIDLYAELIEYINEWPSKIVRIAGEWRIESIVLRLSKKARMLYYHFIKSNTEDQNRESDDLIKAIYAKMDTYALRLALNLEILTYACKNVKKKALPQLEELEALEISEHTLTNALKLIQYFKKTALKVVNKLEDPISRMPKVKASWYRGLKEEAFTTHYAVQTGEALEIARSTIFNYLNDRSIFIKLGRGQYEKRYL